VASLHESGALVALGAGALFAAVAAAAAWRDTRHELVRRLALGLVAVFGVVAALGLVILASGESPADGLHLLYGAVLVGAVPFGLTFASEAPPRARSGVLAVAGLAALLIIWRLFSTG
jgi:heme A synthase